jgi:hypothetical protein
MSPSEVFLQDDWEIQALYESEMSQQPLASGGEDWDSELLVPAQGRLVYVGQGQSHFAHFHQQTPGLLWPKKKRKKRGNKKKGTRQPPPEPAPEPLSPAPIDWSDWEELCQAAPPVPAPPPPQTWEPDDWEAEIAASQWQPEDWDAEIAASQ